MLLVTAGLISSACSEPDSHETQPPSPGQIVWEQNCKVCHSVGLAGSPKFGDKKAWAKRLERGMPSIYQHALEGWGDMPAKGGNPDLSEQQVLQAVDYMVSHSQ